MRRLKDVQSRSNEPEQRSHAVELPSVEVQRARHAPSCPPHAQVNRANASGSEAVAALRGGHVIDRATHADDGGKDAVVTAEHAPENGFQNVGSRPVRKAVPVTRLRIIRT